MSERCYGKLERDSSIVTMVSHRATISEGKGRGSGRGGGGCVALAAHAEEREGKVRANDES